MPQYSTRRWCVLLAATIIAALAFSGIAQAQVVSATPLGPPVPSGGWKVAYANGFGGCIISAPCGLSGAPADNTLEVTTGKPANPSSEPSWYVPSQVAVTPNGLALNCNYDPGVGGTTGTWPDYACGAVDSKAHNATGGSDPSGYRLFHYEPGQGETWAIQTVFQAPPNTGEMDPSPWSIGYNWAWEIDHPEQWGMMKPKLAGWCNGEQQGFPAIPRVNFGGASGQRDQTLCTTNVPDPSLALDTYTVLMKGVTFSSYIDGHLVASGFNVGTVGGWAKDMGGLRIQNSLRTKNASGGGNGNPDPYFMSGTRTMLVRSVAIYENASGAHTVNAGVAPGTTVQ